MTAKFDKIYYLYSIQNNEKIPFYAGRSSNPQKRFKQHLKENKDNPKCNFIKHCIENGIELGVEDCGYARHKASEEELFWDLKNQGYELLNDASCNSSRDTRYIVKDEVLYEPLEVSDMTGRGKWQKMALMGKKQRLKVRGWKLIKDSVMAGHRMWITGMDKEVLIVDTTFDWKHVYAAAVAVTDSWLAGVELPVIESVKYQNICNFTA
ncbi:GIY-YIG nuclease family protein [Methylobacter sp. YRD-M1]|uniref:GIY-YIG nuclease family protein n=1 Tax=Methylobacter sp. YRD-M1 TaxID=2911520 RepID=UPI00227A9F55|nr:GIY-YIG nuclease family protein [Methylobacter sp. YRD-M1]WAK01856.1 GIY-YIG nuclease family protein [Methylobacter sp. YRD-M1]